ncbi:MAG: ATP-binding protein [Pyrinomonadaceae bacterium]
MVELTVIKATGKPRKAVGQLIDSSKLQELLGKSDETPNLEFKLKYVLKGPQHSKFLDEITKDILSLANTAGRSKDDFAYLIIGAGDELRPGGVRDKDDVRVYGYDRQQFLQIVNARCAPPVPDLNYAEIEAGGNYYGVVEIPPSPYVHELTRNLDTPKGGWPQGCVLIRRGEKVGAGMGAIAGGKYRNLKELLLKTRVRWSGADSVTYGLTPGGVLYKEDATHVPGIAGHLTPINYRLHEVLKSPLEQILHSDENFHECFVRFEYLFALLTAAQKVGIPMWSFAWESEIRRGHQKYYEAAVPIIRETDTELDKVGEDWPPLKSGLFDGPLQSFRSFKSEVDQTIIKRIPDFLLGG